MSLETQELRKIFSEIQAEFFNDREIHVHSASGDPPSQYEVTYDIPCTSQDEQGNITISSGHTVIIAIPFGYPHFPPSCKPKSPTFHPDFDSVAICLGDFWNRERTIPELIRYIGKMLRGEVYSLDNAFNAEAAAWFRQNSNILPFDKEKVRSAPAEGSPAMDPPAAEELLETGQLAEPEPEAPLTLSLEPSEEEDESAEISTMKDHDFMEDFHFSEDISEIPASPPSLSGAVKAKINSDRLKHLARKRLFHQLDGELAAIPEVNDFPERRDLEEKTANALQEARTLYAEAESYENQGLSDKALECFKAVESLVSDYPNIRTDVSRTENATEMLKDISGSSATSWDQSAETAQRPDKQRKEVAATPVKSIAAPGHVRRPVNIIAYVLAGGLLCILVPLTYFYFTLSSQLTEARQLFSGCTASFAAKDFLAAEKACTASLAITEQIYLIHQTEISDLQKGIHTILDSEEMQQGLQGKILYNEKYISKSTLSAHQSLQEMLSQGKGFLEASAWDQAAASFQKALELCRQIKDFSPEEQMNIEQNLNYAAFRSMLTVAERQVDQEAWQEATTTLTELQGQINKLSPRQQVEYREYIDNLLAKSQFTDLKEKADALFSQSDWAGAASLFQKAMEAGRSLSEKEGQDLSGIQANISRAELYTAINAGNSAFAQGQWDTAIEKYTQATGIITANAKILNSREVEQSRQKLDRIILQSTILRDRQIAEKSRAQGELTATLPKLQKVLDTIGASSFADDPEFGEIISETRHAQQEVRDAIFIKKLEQYLVDNYTKLFMENYPAASPETLTNPAATFEKRLGSLYLFKLLCTETGRGRPLNLIMFYTYDPASSLWKFYSVK